MDARSGRCLFACMCERVCMCDINMYLCLHVSPTPPPSTHTPAHVEQDGHRARERALLVTNSKTWLPCNAHSAQEPLLTALIPVPSLLEVNCVHALTPTHSKHKHTRTVSLTPYQ